MTTMRGCASQLRSQLSGGARRIAGCSTGRSRHDKGPIQAMDSELSRLNELLDKFKDPSSHYHIPPGTNGPQHEEDHSTSRMPASSSTSTSTSTSTSSPRTSFYSASSTSTSQNTRDDHESSRQEALKFFEAEGYDHDQRGILEWPVAWGDCDMFQHVNNVRFVRWVETARIRYAESLDLPKGQIQGMMSGKGTGFILKSVSMKYIRPVTWPDTVMIASRAHRIQQDKACFDLKHAIWSLKDKRLAAVADSTMVLYDYDRLVKGVMTDEFRMALEARTPGSGDA